MQVELGDMIHWCGVGGTGDTDIGWVVHIENRASSNGLEKLVYIKWLFEDCTDHVWEHTISEHEYMTLIKGGQDDR